MSRVQASEGMAPNPISLTALQRSYGGFLLLMCKCLLLSTGVWYWVTQWGGVDLTVLWNEWFDNNDDSRCLVDRACSISNEWINR